MPNGFSVTQTSRKMSVSAASRMVSAISFGVFCRCAPSTSAIMRSRKPWPFSIVTRMTMRSLRTRVPPVTALRSPPLSRMTGADSPVMADSSTLAMPSTTSPSAGMTSPASQTTRSPLLQFRGRDLLLAAVAQAPGHRVLARLAQAVGLGLAAAFGDGFGEVGEEHGEPEPDGELGDEAALGGGTVKMPTVVSTAPTIVTNMTGFLTISRGSSFRNESPMAGPTMFQSKREGAFWVIRSVIRDA